MRQVIEFLKKIPGKNTILLAIILFLVVWFILPNISLDQSYPFASISARLLILGVLALAWLIKIAIGQLQKHKAQALPLLMNKLTTLFKGIKSGSKNVLHYSKTNYSELKYRVKRDKQKRRLRRLPWYLVLGGQQAGKKTFLANMGLYYAQPEHFGEDAIQYINQHPDFEWWFSEQAVLIDPINVDKERDAIAWKKLLKLLKRERPHKPLNGIILTFSLSDILLYSNQKRQEFIQDICHYIRDLHDSFKSQVPVYMVLTKCDLVEGFMEFFNDMSKEELHQVWGMTIPLADCNDMNAVRDVFTKEYNALVNQLRKRVLWAFDTERSVRGRELIHSFPQQMQLLKKPIETFIIELFGATRYQKALQLRGLYFISSKQEGEPYDFLLSAMSKKFQLVPPTVHRPQRMGECYFARGIMHEVIFPEAPILGDSERSKRMRKTAYNLCMIAAPLLVLLTAVGMYQGYEDNVSDLTEVNNHIANYQSILSNTDLNDPSLTSILPLLDELNAADNLYQNKSWMMDTLFESSAISHALNDTLQRALHSMFLPRVAAQIENDLNQNIADQNMLYATLKGYLAFSASDYSKSNAIEAPMQSDWNKQFHNQPATATKLSNYLAISLEESVEKLPLDRDLINRIRGQLEAIVPSDRAYGLLEFDSTNASDIPDLMLPTAVGGTFSSLFSSNAALKIPALYTRSGFEKTFLKQYENIADEVAHDNQDIGLANDSDETQSSDQISLLMQTTYNSNYINSWQQALSNIQIAPFSNLQQAIATLNTLTSKQSPLPKLLNIVYDNTNSIDNDKVQVDKTFQALNAYSQNQSDGVTWQQTEKTLSDLSQYLTSISQSPNPDQASLQAAEDMMQGKANPIAALSQQAASAPEPVKTWLNAIANNAWQVVVMGAHNQLNTVWDSQVMSTYNSAIQDRYPISESDSQIAIDDFNQFFGTGGVVDAYFNNYIKPFVNTSGSTWQLLSVDGHDLEIPAGNLALFQQAQTIRNEFFPNNAKQANLNFSIKPLTLDNNASSIQLSLGNQSLTYSHGPQFPMAVNWPLPFNNQLAQALINTFDGNQYGRTASGPWGLFKLFSYGNLTQTTSSGNYELDLNFNGVSASFSIAGSAGINVYRLTDLSGFSLPETIAPNANQ